MISENTIEQTLVRLFDDIEFTKDPEGLYDPLRYMIAIGGKRIRPRLCLTAFSLYKDEFTPAVLDAATALEVLHSFTLIHDDIMDKSPIRRGKDTVWKKWNEDTAILSGDVMSIDSFNRIASMPPKVLPAALKLFARTAAQICEGQQYDMEFESRSRVTVEDYLHMIGGKTACLIACSAKMGALAAEASEQDCASLYDYGYNVGLAFQIADDYLDVFADAAEFGKPIGGDIINAKKTWLLIRALEKDEPAVAAAMNLPTGTPELDAAKIKRVTELYRSLGVDEDAKYEILRYHSLAMDCVGKTGLSRVKTELLARYADKMVGRTK